MSAADPADSVADTPRTPTSADAALAVRAGLGVGCRSVQRFPTGSGFYVYDVVANDGRRVVAACPRSAATRRRRAESHCRSRSQ